jgi:hypothetical protein
VNEQDVAFLGSGSPNAANAMAVTELKPNEIAWWTRFLGPTFNMAFCFARYAETTIRLPPTLASHVTPVC